MRLKKKLHDEGKMRCKIAKLRERAHCTSERQIRNIFAVLHQELFTMLNAAISKWSQTNADDDAA